MVRRRSVAGRMLAATATAVVVAMLVGSCLDNDVCLRHSDCDRGETCRDGRCFDPDADGGNGGGGAADVGGMGGSGGSP